MMIVFDVSRARRALGALVLAVTAASCGSPGAPPPARDAQVKVVPAAAPQPQAAAAASRPRIVVLGDSLTAGLGIPIADAYPALLQRRVDAEGLDFEVVNKGVSGDTSAGGLSRLDDALQGDVRVLVVALGGNDALRGLPLEELRGNLAAIVEQAKARGANVVLAGMEAPPNFGRDYIVGFHKVYPSVAAEYHVALVPFLLDGVAGRAEVNQNDGIHPTVAGARIVADTVWSVLAPLVRQQRPQGTRSGGRPGS